MRKKALIFDLDNTIFPVPSIGEVLFAPVFKLIQKKGSHNNDLEKIKDEIMRVPFQEVASKYHFDEDLTKKGIAILKNLVFRDEIDTYPDYPIVRKLPLDKYLVTSGFTKMQKSKIKGLGIKKDFKEIHILDHSIKKSDVFNDIIKKHGYSKDEVLVIGDNPDSEIDSAHKLGIDSVLYDHEHRHHQKTSFPVISDYHQLMEYL